MKRIIALGFASALLMGTAGIANAQQVNQEMNTDSGAQVGLDEENMDLGLDADVDAFATGSISPADRNYGSVVSGLQSGAGTSADFTAYNDSTTINCVSVSSLEGNTDNAVALDNAISANEAQLASLRSELSANADFMGDLQASCAGVAEVTADDVLSIHSSADNTFIVYIDDRA